MFITLDGETQIFATSFGSKSAPAILALSGWIGSWEDWIDPLSILSETWRTLSYDHRGSGSTITPTASITFEQLIDDVFAVLDYYAVDQCVLAAMSMGAAIALGAVRRHPERFSGLVLVDSIDLRPRQASEVDNDQFLWALNHSYAQALDGFINASVPEPNSDHIKHWGQQILDRATQESAIALYNISKTVTLHDVLSDISLPTLVIHGDADQLASLESAEWLVDTLPNAKLEVIHGAGHVPIMTFPHQVADAIDHFFAR
jgi:pimeloyl-ACP methyl ester carboxylesterase